MHPHRPSGALVRWSQDGKFGIRVEPNVLKTLLDDCVRSGRIETGGILIGKYSEDLRLARVETASTNAKDTRAGSAWLVRGVVGLRAKLRKLWSRRAGHYLGEWHYHPYSDPEPSRRDVEQMTAIARSPDYDCQTVLLLIIGGDPNGRWTVHTEVLRNSGERYLLNDELRE